MARTSQVRQLVLVLGDQLDADSAAFDEFDPQRDAVWMAEVGAEAEHVWSHKARIAIFLAGMRHFRDQLRKRGMTVHYRQLDGFLKDPSVVRRSAAERNAVREPKHDASFTAFQAVPHFAGLRTLPLTSHPSSVLGEPV